MYFEPYDNIICRLRSLWILFWVLGGVPLWAQMPLDSGQYTAPFVIIEEVIIQGNRLTKERIILRELDIAIGDTLWAAKQDTVLFRNKNKIFNTDLFTQVKVELQEGSVAGQKKLLIDLQERWYIFPIPLIDLVDRSLNEWWYSQGGDLNRLTYGMVFTQRNLFGLNQTLEGVIQLGFLKRFGVKYAIPYLNQAQTWGMQIATAYTQRIAVPYETVEHQLRFVEASDLGQSLEDRFNTAVSFSRRGAFYTFHSFELGYNYNQAADTVIGLNPNYYLNGRNHQRYLTLRYLFKLELRDVVAYPLRGSVLLLGLTKLGLPPLNDVDMLHINVGYGKYWQLGSKASNWFVETNALGRLTFLNQQPYANALGLGYQNAFLRGYELYVIDGQSYVLSKNALKYRLFDVVKTLNFIPLSQFKKVPLAAYLNIHTDLGYVRDDVFRRENNRFSNRPIYGIGAGLDVVSYYNSVFSFNYSMNIAQEWGLFVNFSAKF